MKVQPNQCPLIFGEVLFDCFPEGRVLGGAPFNVAWNLQGLGCNPLVVTSVGDDELGHEVQQRAATWGLDCRGIQICKGRPTGRVDITTNNGEPSYRFWDDVAFDHIQFDDELVQAARPALLYHGTLALRSQVSRQSIMRMRDVLECPVFIDVNVRLPHYDPVVAAQILRNADHVKLNHDELNLLTQSPNLSVCLSERWEQRRLLGLQLSKQYQIRNLWITAAEEGAAWLGAHGEFVFSPAPKVVQMVDTVGAGDALTAVIIHGLIQGQDVSKILDDATSYAARICTIRGAISSDPSFYSPTAN